LSKPSLIEIKTNYNQDPLINNYNSPTIRIPASLDSADKNQDIGEHENSEDESSSKSSVNETGYED